MALTILSIILGVLGIAGTITAWNLNPKRKLYAELDAIYKELDGLYIKRDKALKNNNSDELTIASSLIVRLCQRKAILFSRARID